MMRLLVCLVLLGAIGAMAAPADGLAQTAPSVDKKRMAKQYVDAGLAAQSAGEYDAAIAFYSKAYELVQHPTLIFNIAQAHRLAGRTEQALTLYRRYLSEDPNGPQAGTARKLVSDLEARRTEEARKAAARSAEEARIAVTARKADERKAEPVQQPPVQAADPAPGDATAAAPPAARASAAPELSQPPRARRIAGLATAAGGAAALAIGIGFGLHARSVADQLSRDGAVFDPATVHAGERANAIAIAGMAGGSALIAVGAALYWWSSTPDRPAERLSLAPMVSQQMAGLVVSGALP